MGRTMRRIGTGSATQRIELGGTTLEDKYDLLCTMTESSTNYNLSASITEYKKLVATSYFVSGTRTFSLCSVFVDVNDITPSALDSIICCFNDGTIRKGQFVFLSNTVVQTAFDANWQNVTKIKLWGIK
jgi:hypothetical protein